MDFLIFSGQVALWPSKWGGEEVRSQLSVESAEAHFLFGHAGMRARQLARSRCEVAITFVQDDMSLRRDSEFDGQ